MILTVLLVTTGALNPVFSVGSDALCFNPAQLALGNHTKLSCRMLSLAGMVHNNSFSIAQYNRYTGAFLNDEMKRDILRSIPPAGFTAHAEGTVGAAECAVGSCAVVLRTEGEAIVRLPRELFEVALRGNELGRVYTAEAKARTQVVTRAGIGFGTGIGRNLAVGVTGHAIRGLYCAELTHMRAEVAAMPYTLTTDVSGIYHLARGGRGWAFDIGIVWRSSGWLVSGAVMDINPGIEWTEGVEEVKYRVRLDSATVYDVISGYRSVGYSSEVTNGRFTTYLPMRVNLGIGRVVSELVNTSLLFTPQCDLGPFNIRKWEILLFTEVRPLRWLPVASSFSFGPSTGFAAGLDAALLLGRLVVRIGTEDIGGLIMGAKGVGFRLELGYGTFPTGRDSRMKNTLRLSAGYN